MVPMRQIPWAQLTEIRHLRRDWRKNWAKGPYDTRASHSFLGTGVVSFDPVGLCLVRVQQV
jgi:hypothetical protein